MNHFLKFAAQKVLDNHSRDLSDVLLLFPNRRSLLFFRQALIHSAGRPIWAPQSYTLDGWVKQHSPYGKTDELSLLIKLHECWVQLGKSDSFESFYMLGQLILKDLERILEHRVNREKFYSDLKALSFMETSYFLEQDETLAQLTIALKSNRVGITMSEIWKVMKKLEQLFHESLLKDGIATPGMIYDEMLHSDRIAELSSGYTGAYAIGFYMSSPAELAILKQFHNLQFIWNKPSLSNCKSLDWVHPMDSFIKDNSSRSVVYTTPETSKEISLYAALGQQQQLQGLSKLLEVIEIDQMESTAVLLPEQGLLLPLLQTLPSQVEDVNVSMGLSVLDSGVYSLLQRFVDCLESWNNNYIKAAPFKLFLEHYLLKPFSLKNRFQVLLQDKQYLPEEEIQKELEDKWWNLLRAAQDPKEILQRISDLLLLVYENIDEDVDRASIYGVFTAINKLKVVVETSKENWSSSFINQFLKRIFQHSRIALSGEPLKGLQLLGGQEMVNLDFEHLIIMDANEGVLPGGQFQSILPISLSSSYRMGHMDEFIQRQEYVFWNAVNGADKISLFYSTAAQGLGQSEPSRWIQRLQLGLHPDNWEIKTHSLQVPAVSSDTKHITIRQSEQVKSQMINWFQNGRISPTALNVWLNCKLKFYLTHILQYKEKEVKNENMDGGHFGSILHNTIEELYKPHAGKVFSKAMIEALEDEVPSILTAQYAQRFQIPLYMVQHGSHKLFFEAIKLALFRVLAIDKQQAPFDLEQTELKLEQSILGVIEGIPLNFFGLVDRVAVYEDEIRIVDFKTGAMKKYSHKAKYENIWKTDDKNQKEAMQTLYYAWLYNYIHPEKSIPVTHLIFSRGQKENADTAVYMDGSKKINEHILQQFQADLFDQIKSMLTVDFDQTSNLNSCKYCPFMDMCGR